MTHALGMALSHSLALIWLIGSAAIAVGSFGAAWFLHRHPAPHQTHQTRRDRTHA
jgi:hypothetical protein